MYQRFTVNSPGVKPVCWKEVIGMKCNGRNLMLGIKIRAINPDTGETIGDYPESPVILGGEQMRIKGR